MRYILLLALTILWASCKDKQRFVELKDKEKGLLIQVTSLKKPSDAADLEYKVRIFHEMKNETEEEKKVKEKMIYGMDSCFYKIDGLNKEYPDAVIPVANGLKNCFEYLVVFSGDTREKDIDTLSYQDKYRGRKIYQLTLK